MAYNVINSGSWLDAMTDVNVLKGRVDALETEVDTKLTKGGDDGEVICGSKTNNVVTLIHNNVAQVQLEQDLVRLRPGGADALQVYKFGADNFVATSDSMLVTGLGNTYNSGYPAVAVTANGNGTSGSGTTPARTDTGLYGDTSGNLNVTSRSNNVATFTPDNLILNNSSLLLTQGTGTGRIIWDFPLGGRDTYIYSKSDGNINVVNDTVDNLEINAKYISARAFDASLVDPVHTRGFGVNTPIVQSVSWVNVGNLLTYYDVNSTFLSQVSTALTTFYHRTGNYVRGTASFVVTPPSNAAGLQVSLTAYWYKWNNAASTSAGVTNLNGGGVATMTGPSTLGSNPDRRLAVSGPIDYARSGTTLGVGTTIWNRDKNHATAFATLPYIVTFDYFYYINEA